MAVFGLLFDPSSWIAWATLTGLELVLGVDNLVVLAMIVAKMPGSQQRPARIGGLALAMATRIALLFAVVWLVGLNTPWMAILGWNLTGRRVALLCGGVFLLAKGSSEIHDAVAGELSGRRAVQARNTDSVGSVLAGVFQIALIDIVFSLDSVFTAIGFAQRVEVMIAAIVTAMLFMMAVAGRVGELIARNPALRMLALAFLLVIGVTLIADALDHPIPKSFLYFSMAFVAFVQWLKATMKKRSRPSRGIDHGH